MPTNLLVEDSKSVINYDKSGVLSQFAPFFSNHVLRLAVCVGVQHKRTLELCHGLEQLCHDLLSFCQGLWLKIRECSSISIFYYFNPHQTLSFLS